MKSQRIWDEWYTKLILRTKLEVLIKALLQYIYNQGVVLSREETQRVTTMMLY